MVLAAFAVLALGGTALADGVWCPSCQPSPTPCCYTAFWVGEEVHFRLVLPFGFFWCCDTGKPMITGWHVEDMGGNVVYQEILPEPADPCCREMVWTQVDASGNQVAAGFYKIVVETTAGNYENYVKIVEKDCCWCPFGPWSRPCGVPLCKPYVKIYRCPTCPTCVAPPFPCCSITLFLGTCDGN